jgi:hypothetical protein
VRFVVCIEAFSVQAYFLCIDKPAKNLTLTTGTIFFSRIEKKGPERVRCQFEPLAMQMKSEQP